jgi:hypothetical protein
MAIMTRWRCPPESWCGIGAQPLHRFADAHFLKKLDDALARCALAHAAMDAQDLADLPLDRVQRIERGHRLLEDHGDLVAADGAQRLLVLGHQVLAAEQDLPGRMRGRGVGQQLEHRQCRDRLARAGFSHQRHGLAGGDVERHMVDGDHLAPALGEGHRQVADRKQRVAGQRAHLNVFLRIEGVANGRFAHEDQQRQHDRQRQEARDAEPGRVEVALALPQQFAERGRARRQAEAKEVERGQRRDRSVEDEGQEGQRRHHRIGQQVAEHDRPVADTPERARGVDIFEVARPQELRAHHADERHPREQQHDAEQDEEARRQHRRR